MAAEGKTRLFWCPPWQLMAKQRCFGRRCGSGWQKIVFSWPDKIADDKKSFFWSPPWRRTAKQRFSGHRQLGGWQNNDNSVIAGMADGFQRPFCSLSPLARGEDWNERHFFSSHRPPHPVPLLLRGGEGEKPLARRCGCRKRPVAAKISCNAGRRL